MTMTLTLTITIIRPWAMGTMVLLWLRLCLAPGGFKKRAGSPPSSRGVRGGQLRAGGRLANYVSESQSQSLVWRVVDFWYFFAQLAHYGVQEKPQKVVHFPMNKPWYLAIKSGAKFWEFRKASAWRARCDGATHALFRLGPSLALA